MRRVVSLDRLHFDLIVQLFLGGMAGLAFLLRLSLSWWLVPALVLIGWQLFSATELRWRYRLLSRDRILLTQLASLIAVPLLWPIYGLLSWLPVLTVAGVHLLRSRREYATVRRRTKRFWDL